MADDRRRNRRGPALGRDLTLSGTDGVAADAIITGGPILTLDSARPTAEAVATRGEHIVAVGDRDSVLALRGPGTEIVDVGGACVLPGLVEPHTHPDLCAQCYGWIDVSGFTHAHVEGVEAALAEAVAGAAGGEWLFAFGLDPMLTAHVGTWGRDRLDRIAPENPLVVMIQSMHTVFVNSCALERSGIDEDTPDPAGGGRYQRDSSGRLTGKLEEAAAALPLLRFMDQSVEAVEASIWEQYGRYARAGLTTIGMPGMFLPLPMLEVFAKLARRDALPVRLVAYLRHHQVDAVDWKPGDGDERFRVQGVKLWYDGSPYSGTMLVDDPYLE